MEEEEDDFYGGVGQEAAQDPRIKAEGDPIQDSQMDDEEDESEEDDSDDDVVFTLDRPPDAPKTDSRSRFQKREPTPQPQASSAEPTQPRSSSVIKQESRTGSTAPPAAVKGALTHRGKEGKDFPEVRTSKVDVEANPTWPPNDKPITSIDLDADLAESSRLWRLPGTDQTDFFNYGFDEYTWAQYCLRQSTIPAAIADQKQQDAQMKAMFGGGGGSGPNGSGANAGMPPGMPSMPGMPSPEEFFSQMMSSGMNPGDPDQFMQMMMSGGMPGMGGQPGGGGGGGGFGGQNPSQKTASPHPQAGQNFQPPTGPASQQNDQGGFPPNMEGYSPQQIAIMQGGGIGGAPTGPSGPRRGGRRGRGYY